MTSAVDARLQRLLGGESLQGLRLRLRRYYARAAAGIEPERFRIGRLGEAEHTALAALLGAPPQSAASIRLDIGAIDRALRDAGIATSLRDALERLDGPIIDIAAARADAQARWSAVVADCRHEQLGELLRRSQSLGLVKRLVRQDARAAVMLLARTATVLQRLPAAGVPRAQLAAETLGDSHALDAGRAEATLVLSCLRLARSQAASDDEQTDDDERARDLWAAAGVLVNELARPALLLNLATHGAGVTNPGEPAYWSLRRLVRQSPGWDVAGHSVHICENPNLVAIVADQLGPRSRPLVCTEGMPAAAQRTLLAQLRDAGARLLYHGDFDWPGVRIANYVMREFGAHSWRFGAADYEAAARLASGGPLPASLVTARWDDGLAPAMQRVGVGIAEEAVAGLLLSDLLA